MKMPLRLTLIAMLAVLAMLAAACGSGEEPAAPVAPLGGSAEPAVPSPDPNPGDTPLPVAPPDDPTSLGGVLVDGGLSVPDALATDATGIIAVKGFLVVDDGGARLCELLAESLPPLCGGASIPIAGYVQVLSAPLSEAQGVSWTDQLVSFLGEIVDGTLVVDPTALQ